MCVILDYLTWEDGMVEFGLYNKMGKQNLLVELWSWLRARRP